MDRGVFYRLSKAEIAAEKARADKVATMVINILRQPVADTFLGRKHYELIPLPHETEIEPAVRLAAE